MGGGSTKKGRTVSRFTPEMRAGLLARVELGASLRDAAEACSVAERTVKTWITKGNRGDERYEEFVLELEAARARSRKKGEHLSEHEFLTQLTKQVRAGSVSAMKLWWEVERERKNRGEGPLTPEAEESNPLDALDEIAEARARKEAAGG